MVVITADLLVSCAPPPKLDTPPLRAAPIRRSSLNSCGNEERTPSRRPDTGNPLKRFLLHVEVAVADHTHDRRVRLPR